MAVPHYGQIKGAMVQRDRARRELAPMIQIALELRKIGSLEKVARQINERGFRTRKYKKLWTKTTLWQVLNREK
jgi:hypothetical protein